MRLATVLPLVAATSAAGGLAAAGYVSYQAGYQPTSVHAAAGAAVVGVAVLLGLAVAAAATRPLRRVRAAAERVRKGDLSVRADASLAGDAGEVARAFNEAIHAAEQSHRGLSTQVEEYARGRREAQLRFAALARASHEGVWEYDPQTQALQLTTAARTLLAPKPGADEAMPLAAFLDRLHPEDRDRTAAALRESAAGRRDEFSLDVRVRAGDDAWRWVRTRAAAVPEGEARPSHVVGVLQDLTDRQRAEETAAEARLRASAADRRSAELLARVGHALRARVGAGAAPAGGVPVDLRRMAENLGDLGDLEAGRLRPSVEAADVRLLAEEAVKVLAPLAASKRLEFGLEVDEEVPLRLALDAARLRRILENLLENSIRATERGEVVLSIAARSKGAEAWELLVWVKDTGPGLTRDQVEGMFEPFAAGDEERLGIGLPVSRRLVEALGGRVGVEASPGRGTTIHFVLPAELVPAPDARRADAARSRLKGRRLLLIDDNATTRRVLVREAARWGMEAMAASTAAEAVEALAGPDPLDVVLVDETLPRDEARHLARRIRENPDRARVPVVLLARRGSPVDDGLLAAAGVDAALAKPVFSSEFYETLAGAVDRAAFVEPVVVVAASEPKTIQVPEALRPTRVEVAASPPSKKRTRKRKPAVGGAEGTPVPSAAHAPRRATGPLDHALIESVRAEAGNPAAFAARIDQFLVGSSQRLAELRGSLAAADLPNLDQAATGFAAASRALGALAVAALCDEILQLARAGDLPEATRRVQRLDAAYRAAKRALEVERSKVPA